MQIDIALGLMKATVLLAVASLLTACQFREAMPKHPTSESKSELTRKAAELDASFPPEVREKLAELRKQSEALPRPTNLLGETLRSINDKDLDFALSWYVTERIRLSGGSREEVLSEQPAPLQSFYLVWLLEAEVFNGGFNQYFWNVSPELVEGTQDALLQIGATEVLELFRHALSQGKQESAKRNALKTRQSLEAFTESYQHSKLEEYDSLFVKVATELPIKRIAYVRANEANFAKREP